MSDDSVKSENEQRIREVLAKTSPADFDGHTEFASLSAEQKLLWLSQAAAFFYSKKNKA